MKSAISGVGVPGPKTALTPMARRRVSVVSGDYASGHDDHIVHAVLLKALEDQGEELHVGA